MKYRIVIFSLLLNSITYGVEHDSDSLVFFSGDLVCFLNNLEYYNPYREGEPFFGSYAQFRMFYRPFPAFTFSLGLHIRKDIGDESFLSDIRPLFRGQYRFKDFSLILGELPHTKRHGLLDPLLREQFIYNPIVEEGIQILYKNATISQDTWGIYPALNTPKHREKLCIGNTTLFYFGFFRFSMMGFITHFGGQLYAPKNDPVRENATAALGVRFTKKVSMAIEQMGIEYYLLGSSTTDTTHGASRNYDGGWGNLVRIWMVAKGVMGGVTFYKGNDYTTWEGNPMYQSDELYYFIDLGKSITLPKNIFIDFGFRLDFLDMYPHQYFENGDHQIWLSMGCFFLQKIR